MINVPTASPNDIPMSLATSAFNNTSHFPERGGKIARDDYANAFNRWAEQIWRREPQEGTREKLAKLERKQEWMKRINALVRKALKDEAPVQWLAPRLVDLANELGEKVGNDGIPAAARVLTPDCMGDVGFPSYALRNNNADIRRIKQRIAEVEARAEQETTERTAGDVQIGDKVNY